MLKKKKSAKKSAQMVKARKPAPKPAKKPTAKPAANSQVAAFRDAVLRHLKSTFARDRVTATRNDWWRAVSLTVRGRVLERAYEARRSGQYRDVKRAYYLSLEYLMGRLLVNNLVNQHIVILE